MSIQLSEKHKSLIQKIGDMKEKIMSRNRLMDETQEFPWDICRMFAENHILDLPIPEKYGGGGSDSFTCCLVIEEIARFSPSAAHLLAGHWLGFTPLELYCTSAQKDKYFPRLRTEIAAFALTEPAAGSMREASSQRLRGMEAILFSMGQRSIVPRGTKPRWSPFFQNLQERKD